tara:strand:- start:5704 stop:6078 length:375 start_codon:yes stop_codon:yes gene_type:complete
MSFINKKPLKPLVFDKYNINQWVLIHHTWKGLVYENDDWYEYYDFEATFSVGLREVDVYCAVSHQWTEYHSEGGYLEPDDHGISSEHVDLYNFEVYDDVGDDYNCSDEFLEQLTDKLLELVIYV